MEMSAAPLPLLGPGLDVAGLAKRAPTNEKAMDAAAAGFESVFMSMLVKEMRQTSDGSSLLFGHDTGDVLGGLFDYYMGQHLAQSGGLGIAAMIKKSWQKHASNPIQQAAVSPATRHPDRVQAAYRSNQTPPQVNAAAGNLDHRAPNAQHPNSNRTTNHERHARPTRK
jgi:peptidoglycan hydrolase FlgJ